MAKPKLAYFSPVPPSQTGVGTYSAELIPHLAEYYDIDVFDDAPEGIDPEGIQPIPSAKFESASASYDRVLYHLGNSRYHTAAIGAMERHPGVVMLHDFFIGAALQPFSGRTGDFFRFCEWVQRSHGYAGLQAVALARDDGDMHAMLRLFPCNFPAIADALGVIVHSEYSRSLASKWYGKAAVEKIRVIPHLRVIPEPCERETTRQRLGLKPSDLLICSFGFVGQTKRSRDLLDAYLGFKLPANENVVLAFVGEAGDNDYNREFLTAISGAGPRVRLTGWADEELYTDYLCAADLAVQLRTDSRGETSGAVLDCMARRVPLIVNANGWFAEISPNDALVLPDDLDVAQVAKALEDLISNPERREALASSAYHTIESKHSPEACAREYHERIEAWYASPAPTGLKSPAYPWENRDDFRWEPDPGLERLEILPPHIYVLTAKPILLEREKRRQEELAARDHEILLRDQEIARRDHEIARLSGILASPAHRLVDRISRTIRRRKGDS